MWDDLVFDENCDIYAKGNQALLVRTHEYLVLFVCQLIDLSLHIYDYICLICVEILFDE
ncbi:hypothetical protein CDL12_00881 [Handroanthus impetiginosus]|uniref:Uncharacterized protein n=1 Tax=Handroanthus impetiginosus TaxID=429701 RepID=A0A2G9I9E1_9LAMI|nr:hypothetical protein CDL12_00881 [Handroanthus impetiginosus]